ncbi:MAG TPA: hypothetical protein VKV04_04640 [Verrucomicrobiae bacterium]|nr:hypothetical protein [Verrucomicrobiae bacterium]
MKRILIALTIFAAALGIFRSLNAATEKLRIQTRAEQDAWRTQTQKIEQISIERDRLQMHLEELGQEIAAAQQADPGATAGEAIPKPGAILSAKEREKLLAELNLNWNSTGDYVVVSKETLRGIGLPGVKHNKLSGVACDVLAMTPDERASVNSALQSVAADYQAWAQSHVQREDPSGDVVAKYTLPVDPQFSQTLSNTFVSGAFDTLGQERGQLLESYSWQWMTDLGLTGNANPDNPITLTIKHYQSGDQTRLGLEFRNGGSTMSTDVSPWQPVPEPFQALFPGGWPDIAKQAGFELPKEFNKH